MVHSKAGQRVRVSHKCLRSRETGIRELETSVLKILTLIIFILLYNIFGDYTYKFIISQVLKDFLTSINFHYTNMFV